jgi:hypothetical protein
VRRCIVSDRVDGSLAFDDESFCRDAGADQIVSNGLCSSAAGL